MLAIKDESLCYSSEYALQVDNTLREFLEENFNNRVEGIMCRSCSGFIPYSNNKGGYEATSYDSQLQAYFQPTTFKEFDEQCVKTYNYLIEYNLEEENISKEDYEKGIDNDDADMLALREEVEQSFGEYESSQFRVLLKLESETMLFVSFMLSASDAPYHRGYDSCLDFEVKFNNVDELKKQLDEIIKDDNVVRFQWIFDEGY